MATSAYRLYSFKLKANGRGEALELDGQVRELAEDVISSLAAKGPIFGWPQLRERSEEEDDGKEETSEKTVPAFNLLGFTWMPSKDADVSHLHFEVGIGEQGVYPSLAEPDGTTTDIGGGAAQAYFRVDLFFPRAGVVGVAALEVVGSSDPRRLLTAHWAKTSKELRAQRTDEIKAEREALKAAGTRVGPMPKVMFPTITFERLADGTKVREVLEGAKSSTVAFYQHESSSRGGDSMIIKRVVRVRLTEEHEFDKAVDRVKGWIRGMTNGDDFKVPKDGQTISGPPDEGAEEPLTMEGEVASAWDDFAGDEFGEAPDFDLVQIEVDPGAGASRTFSLNVLNQIFTYSLGSGRAFDGYYYQGVCGRLQMIVSEDKIPVTIPVSSEVAGCRTDWIQGRSS